MHPAIIYKAKDTIEIIIVDWMYYNSVSTNDVIWPLVIDGLVEFEKWLVPV